MNNLFNPIKVGALAFAESYYHVTIDAEPCRLGPCAK